MRSRPFSNIPGHGIEFRSLDETQAADSHAILGAWDKSAWNTAKATRLMGIDRVTLYRKIKGYNLTEDTPNVEVLHVTQKSCNASVACNTPFSCRL